MKIISLLLLLIGLLYSCQPNIQESSVYRPVEQAEFRLPLDTVSMAECISSIRYIPLETPPEAFIYEADKVLVDSGYIYIADLRGDKIVAYDNQGKYLYCLDKKGNGPGEYLEMRNFTTTVKSFILSTITIIRYSSMRARMGLLPALRTCLWLRMTWRIWPTGNSCWA